MPTYLIEGKKVRAEKPLTDDEIDEIAASIRGTSTSPEPSPDVTVTKIGDREVVAEPRGFFERLGTVGPSVGLVESRVPSRMTPEELAEQAKFQGGLAAGVVAGPMLATATRFGGTVLPAAQRILTPLARAFETGGFSTGRAPGASRVGDIGYRLAGGAGTGGVSTAVVAPEEAGTGAVVGGTLAATAPPALGFGARVAGWVGDLISRNLPKVEANKLINLTVRGEMDQVRNAMLANPDALPSRIAADLDYPTLSALLKRYEAEDLQNTAALIRRGEVDKFVNELSALAGGETATVARTARGARRKAVVEDTAKLREAAFAKARKTGEVMPLLEVIASRARADAADAVGFVRRMGPAIDRANEWSKTWVASGGARPAGAPRPPAKYTYAAELAQFADDKMTAAAATSREAGGRARAAENTLQSMRDRGLTPIQGSRLVPSLRGLLRDPEIAENAQARAGVEAVVDAIGRWTNDVGVITPEALYAIRKNAVSDAVRKLMPGADEKSVQRFAAKVLSNINPKLDEAIARAGGKEWPEYLSQFSKGMDEIKRMAFFDELRLLAEKNTASSRQKLYRVIAGEDPEFIEDVFGPERFDINQMVPEQRQLFEDLLVGMRQDRKAAEKAKEGAAAFRRAEKKIGGLRVRFPWFSRLSSIGNEFGRALETALDEKTQDAIIYAAQSGRNFADVLDALPAKDRIAVVRIFQNPNDWPNFVGQIAQAAQAQAQTPTNYLTPEATTTSQNALRTQP